MVALLSACPEWYCSNIHLRWSGMKFLHRHRFQVVFVLLAEILLATPSWTQTEIQIVRTPIPRKSKPAVAVIQGVRVIPERNGPSVEIVSSSPLVPNIATLEGPPRLVIDLPNATVRRKHIVYQSEQMTGVRVDQFQNDPPVARVVIDLLGPTAYKWDAAGNRLMVRLHAGGETAPETPTVAGFTEGVQPAAVPLSPGSSGALVEAGVRLAAGSSLTAGPDTAILNLTRGGQVRVCPRTTISVTSSPNGRDLMLGMSTGSLEAHYTLDASADSVLTPDFRIVLAGPGEFHYAVSVDSRGNTCVRSLPGNTASVIVSELIGDGTYQVKPAEQVVFRSGQLRTRDKDTPIDCGCPPPLPPVMRASGPTGPEISDASLPASSHLAQLNEQATPMAPLIPGSNNTDAARPSDQVTISTASPETAPLPPSQANDVHVQVEAPLVFRASNVPRPAEAPIEEAQQLPLTFGPRAASLQTVALPPPGSERKKQKPGFFGRVKGLFVAMFR